MPLPKCEDCKSFESCEWQPDRDCTDLCSKFEWIVEGSGCEYCGKYDAVPWHCGCIWCPNCMMVIHKCDRAGTRGQR